MTYHSALTPDPLGDVEPRDFWASEGNMAFVHDIANGYPAEWADASVVYTDVPWADGFEEFQNRAGVLLPMTYEEWLFRFSAVLLASGKPFVIVGGHKASRHLAAEWHHPVMLNGSLSVAMGARLPKPRPEIDTAAKVMQWLSGNPVFEVVADPCCGTGSVAREFALCGKSFIASDINARCVGYIAKEARKWVSSSTI